MKKLSIQIIRNVMTNWASYFIGTIVGFLMMPFIIQQLGDAKYGIWVLVISTTGYLDLFDFGVSGSIVKYVAELTAKKDKTTLNQFCSTVFYLHSGLCILVCLTAVFIAFNVIGYFNIPFEQLKVARWLTIIIGITIGMSLVIGFFSGYMRGIQRYDLVALISVIILLLRTALTVVFLLLGYGLIALAVIQLLSTVISGCIKIFFVFKTNPDLTLKPRLINRKQFHVVLQYSIYIFLYYLARRVIFSTDTLVIGYFLSTTAVTFYSIPLRLVEYIRFLIMSMSGVLIPAVSHYDIQGEKTKIHGLLISGTKYSLMIALPIAASFILVGEEFIALWISPKHALMSYPVLVVLAFAIIAHIAQYTPSRILMGLAKHNITAYTALCEALLNAFLSIILVQKYGIIGVAVGTLIPMVCISFVIIPLYTCRITGLSFLMYLRSALISPFIAVFLYAIVLFGLREYISITSWLQFVVTHLIAVTCYAISAWFICLSTPERSVRFQQFRAVLNSAL